MRANPDLSFICAPFLLPPYQDPSFRHTLQDVVALRENELIKPAIPMCVGTEKKMGLSGCTMEFAHQELDNTLGVKRVFLNPQSHPDREFAKAIATYMGVLESPYMLCRNKNDLQYLAESSKKYGNVAVFPEKVKLDCYGEAYKPNSANELVNARYELTAFKNICPKVFRNDKGERSASNLTQ